MLALTREVEDASFILSGHIHGNGKEAVEALEIMQMVSKREKRIVQRMRRNYYEKGYQNENLKDLRCRIFSFQT